MFPTFYFYIPSYRQHALYLLVMPIMASHFIFIFAFASFPLLFTLPLLLTVQRAVLLLCSEKRDFTQSNWVTTLSMEHTLWCCSMDGKRCVSSRVLVHSVFGHILYVLTCISR